MGEWRRGWPVVLGCALGTGTGIALLFFSFSIFNLHLIREFGGTHGDLANIQALVVLGAIGSPLAGWAADRFGFRNVFIASMMSVVAIELSVALLVDSMAGFAIAFALIGLFGVGTTAVTTTRPVNAWFSAHRGLALGVAACGIATATIIVPPVLEAIVSGYGWRMGFVGLAVLAFFIGLPAVVMLVDNEPPEPLNREKFDKKLGVAFLQRSDFWVMAFALMAIGAAQTGFIGQMSPMLQAEGLSAQAASLGLSAFAVGTLVGRLSGGWSLDKFDPQKVAIFFTLLPTVGFLILWGFQSSVIATIFAALVIGFQQGAEIDIFAYFTARKYGIAQYGTVYGTLLGLSWLGNVTGLIGVGSLRDMFGDYGVAQLAGAMTVVVGALLVAMIRLPSNTKTATAQRRGSSDFPQSYRFRTKRNMGQQTNEISDDCRENAVAIADAVPDGQTTAAEQVEHALIPPSDSSPRKADNDC